MVSSATGGTYVAQEESGRLEQFILPGHGTTTPPTTDGKQVYILTNNGHFYAYALN
jgi:hypothetical protein